MAWNKIKSMFVVSAQVTARDSAVDTDQVLNDLAKYELPPSESAPLAEGIATDSLSGAIDFQGIYDQAGIPNTDEVESLERFLHGLDESLPESSKLAAAKAFLGAIGKAPGDVINDAGRKINVVRSIAEAKRADIERASGERQSAVAALQKQIDEHRAAVETLQRDLEAVRSQCAAEESRLQGARMFFGHVSQGASAGKA